ncbi:efflux transporter outer membrane subunit [Acidisoma silvae]|uniref:Efflux transporter outer membrane subunit n=1 Tax=Acidisoma silvae TaxID=2802396 RepID=A0A964E156_9PROT|nr:efflux transporter outer membrane subunit [Acidisoma silvae]MCB8877859.1 efflux transporter outer membrane subunit [Acidisoma silvae]
MTTPLPNIAGRHTLRAATGLLLALSACTVGPDWQKPSLSIDLAYNGPVGAVAPSRIAQIAFDPAWWRIFNDPELTSLEERAATSNLDIAIASADFSASQAARRIVAADQYPSSDANASYARERASPNGVLGLLDTTGSQNTATVANGTPEFGPAALPGSSGSSAFDLWQYGFDASWELDLWGRVRREVEAANASVEMSADERRGALVSVQAETASDYFQLRGLQSEIAIAQQNLGLARHSLALTQIRLSNGATTNLDVANAMAQVHAIAATLPPLQQQEAQMVNALSFILGKPPRALTAELATPTPLPPVPPVIPIGFPSELAAQRPDIRAAEAKLHETTAEIGVAVADFYPRITLSGSLDIQALQFGGLDTWASRQYGFGPTISMPLFQGGRLRGTVKLRKVQQKKAAIAYQRTVLQAWREIDDAMTAYNAAQNQRTQLQEAVGQNHIALAAAQSEYAQGAADFLNVLEVQNQMLITQRDLIRATTDTDEALVSLYKALGGGWQTTFPSLRATGAPPKTLSLATD